MEVKPIAVFGKCEEGYAAVIEELPGVNRQGQHWKSSHENLEQAGAMIFHATANWLKNRGQPAHCRLTAVV